MLQIDLEALEMPKNLQCLSCISLLTIFSCMVLEIHVDFALLSIKNGCAV